MVAIADRIDDFDFVLPEELIALRPLTPRSDARLLVVRGEAGTVEDRHIGDLPELLAGDDILVMNSSRVIKAALSAIRPARSDVGSDVSLGINLNRRLGPDRWSAFVRPAKRVAVGDRLNFAGDLTAEVVDGPSEGECVLRFCEVGADLDRMIDEIGDAPLPPYITSRRAVDAQDAADYQTCFAETGESVAAPTAGLHLSEDILENLSRTGVRSAKIRLDVNAGTFRPVKADRLSEHQMHFERVTLPEEIARTINDVRTAGGRCVAVGTTSMRALESAGRKGRLEAFDGDTNIFIKPGFSFRICDGLLTNFHLPRSTLFVLVSAFMGVDVMRRAYEHAIRERYRFYSYGDACLLLPHG